MGVKDIEIDIKNLDDYKLMLFGSINLKFIDGNEFNLCDENVIVI